MSVYQVSLDTIVRQCHAFFSILGTLGKISNNLLPLLDSVPGREYNQRSINIFYHYMRKSNMRK